MSNIFSTSGNYFKSEKVKDFFAAISSSGIIFFRTDNHTTINYVSVPATITDFFAPEPYSHLYISTSESGVLKFFIPYLIESSNDLQRYLIRHRDTNTGLPSNNVFAIDGTDTCLFAATSSGLYIQSDTLTHVVPALNQISLLKFNSKSNSLYFATPSGVGVKADNLLNVWYDPTYRFNVNAAPSLMSDVIQSLEVTGSGVNELIAIGTASGIDLINLRTNLETSNITHLRNL